MRCIWRSVGKGWIFELRFAVEALDVQFESEGRSPTNDCGRSPASDILGGGSIFESCFCFFSVKKGMLCLELRTRAWGAIGGSAVRFDEFQPMTGESALASLSLGDDSVVCTVKSALPRCMLGVARLRLPVP